VKYITLYPVEGLTLQFKDASRVREFGPWLLFSYVSTATHEEQHAKFALSTLLGYTVSPAALAAAAV